MDSIKKIDSTGQKLPEPYKMEHCANFLIEPISIFRIYPLDEDHYEDIVFCKINDQPVALQVATDDILNYIYQFLPEKPVNPA